MPTDVAAPSARRLDLRAALRAPAVRRWLIGGGLFVVLTASAAIPHVPRRVALRVGVVSPVDVASPRTVEYRDPEQAAALREAARLAVPPVVRRDPDQIVVAQTEVSRRFDALASARSAPAPSLEERIARARQTVGDMPEPALVAAMELDARTFSDVRAFSLQAIRQVMSEEILPGGEEAARGRARAILRTFPLRGRALTLASAAVLPAVRPSVVVDVEATERRRREAEASVVPPVERILQDQVIVRRGEVVTPADFRRLEAVGLVGAPLAARTLTGIALVVMLLLGIVALYLARYQPQIWGSERHLLLLAIVIGTTGALTPVVAARFSGYLMPVAAGPMVIAILLNPRLALFAAAALSLFAGLVAEQSLGIAIISFVGGVMGVYTIKSVHHRSDLAYAGLQVGAANVAAIAAFGLSANLPLYPQLLGDAVTGALNGVLAGVITIGVLPYLENLFRMVTPIKLLELSDPSHPLLRRLQLEATGTYHHSVMVANLAEVACEAIGANGLLARVGAYYHDVGKLRRPVFFIENQMGVENPHDTMAPSLSALTVSAHVRDGLAYAREYRLPEAIAAFIPEHHGTMLIQYFYSRAKQRGEAREDPFRYPGPKPRTREAAVVMLADSVEAAARALSRPTPDRVEQVVRRLIRERLEDGQLDECDLTFRDLGRIAEAFVRILSPMFHPRLDYPDAEAVSRPDGRHDRPPAGRDTR